MADRRVSRWFSGQRRGHGALGADRRGSVVLLTALLIMVILGGVGFAVDLSRLYLARVDGQRIADQSAVAAAMAYMQSSSSASTAATKAAQSLATVNGASGATVTATAVTSPSGDGNNAIQVTVAIPVTLSPFGQLLKGASSVVTDTVTTSAYSEITDTVKPCIISLSGSITTSGGYKTTATDCAVASAANVSIPYSSAGIVAQAVYAVGSISTAYVTGQTFPGSKAPTDPYASAGVFNRISTVSALTSPSFPSSTPSAPSAPSATTPGACTGSSCTQSCSGSLSVAAGKYTAVGDTTWASCAMTFTGGAETDISGQMLLESNSTITINMAAGTYKIGGGISVSGSTNVTINATGPVVLDVWGGITNGSGTLTINGPVTYNIMSGGITNNNGKITLANTSTSSASSLYVVGNLAVGSGGVFNFTSLSSTSGSPFYVSGNVSVSGGSGVFYVSAPLSSVYIGGSTSNSSSTFTIADVNSSGSIPFYFGGAISNSGTFSVSAPAGTYYIPNGIGGSSGNGNVTFTNTSSSLSSTFYVGGGILIAVTGTTTFPNGTYVISSGDGTAGIDITGNSAVTFGNGSFQIAKGINVGNGSLTFGSAVSSSSLFQVTGTNSAGNAITTASKSSANLTIGAFPYIDLNGPVSLGAAASFGGSTYAGDITVNGSFTGSAGSGTSSTFSVNNASLIIGGNFNFSGGWPYMNFSAPTAITSSTDGTLPTIALAAKSSTTSTFTAGAYGMNVSGALYVPNATLSLNASSSGKGTVYGGSDNTGSGCAVVIGNSINVVSGGTITTTCASLGSSSGTVALVK